MDAKRIEVVVPAPVEPPRGAEWAANTVVWIWQRLRKALRILQRRPAHGEHAAC